MVVLDTKYNELPCPEPKSLPYTQHNKPKIIYNPIIPQCRSDLEYPYSIIKGGDCGPCIPILKNTEPKCPVGCLNFSTISNQPVTDLKLFTCNYPNLDSTQIQELINKKNSLVEEEQCRIINPNSCLFWYQNISIVNNLPSSIPFTQHTKDTNEPYPINYPSPNINCQGCGDSEYNKTCCNQVSCNNRTDCNYCPYPQPPAVDLCCPPNKSIPYTQHKLCKPEAKSFNIIRNDNFPGLLNYSIELVNNYTKFYENKTSWITTPTIYDLTTTSQNIKPCEMFNGIINISNAINETTLIFPSSVDVCNELKGKFINTRNIEFQFTISNSSSELMKMDFSVDPSIYSTWNSDPLNINIGPGETASFFVYLQSCISGQEQYYVINTSNI